MILTDEERLAIAHKHFEVEEIGEYPQLFVDYARAIEREVAERIAKHFHTGPHREWWTPQIVDAIRAMLDQTAAAQESVNSPRDRTNDNSDSPAPFAAPMIKGYKQHVLIPLTAEQAFGKTGAPEHTHTQTKEERK